MNENCFHDFELIFQFSQVLIPDQKIEFLNNLEYISIDLHFSFKQDGVLVSNHLKI